MRVRELSLFAALLLALPGSAGTKEAAPPPSLPVQHAPAPAESAPPADVWRALDRRLERYLRGRPGRAALAVHDRTTGARYAFRERASFLLASVAKVDVLLAFLMRARDRRLSAYERRLVSQMIRHSDNHCARELYAAVGGADGLARTLRRLGVRHIEPGAATEVGYTRSRASEQVEVLERLLVPGGPLPDRARRYALELMSSVEPSQAWGVSAAAAGGEAALKNGWLPAEQHGGLWTVNSVGRLIVAGHDLVIAVLSERSPTMEAGVATVERMARMAVAAATGWPAATGARPQDHSDDRPRGRNGDRPEDRSGDRPEDHSDNRPGDRLGGAAPAPAAAAARSGRGGAAGHRDRGQQLHRVVVALGADGRVVGGRHRTGHLEGGAAGAASEVVTRHAAMVTASGVHDMGVVADRFVADGLVDGVAGGVVQVGEEHDLGPALVPPRTAGVRRDGGPVTAFAA